MGKSEHFASSGVACEPLTSSDDLAAWEKNMSAVSAAMQKLEVVRAWNKILIARVSHISL